jgi:hypothetical protein
MKPISVTSALLMALFVPNVSAQDCRINDVEETTLGTNRAIEGTCSNSGLPVRCTYNEDNSIGCEGPGGTFSGDDVDTLIISACGCRG